MVVLGEADASVSVPEANLEIFRATAHKRALKLCIQEKPDFCLATFSQADAKETTWLTEQLGSLAHVPQVFLVSTEADIPAVSFPHPTAFLVPPLPAKAMLGYARKLQASPLGPSAIWWSRLVSQTLLGGASPNEFLKQFAKAFSADGAAMLSPQTGPLLGGADLTKIDRDALVSMAEKSARTKNMLITGGPTGQLLLGSPLGGDRRSKGAIALCLPPMNLPSNQELLALRMVSGRIALEVAHVALSKTILPSSTTQQRIIQSANAETLTPAEEEPIVSLPEFAPGALLGGMYRITHRISGGAMGTVFAGEDLALGRPVAIKALRGKFGRDENFLKRFKDEASLLASLSHPNLVQIFTFGSEGEQVYFVMELVDGIPLSGVIGHHSSAEIGMDAYALATVIDEVADALDEIHSVGIIHRDVKPANIILDRVNARAVLVDVGIASEQTGKREAAGTPGYAAPESLSAEQDASPATDVYGLAATAYIALTGQPPFGSGTVLEILERQRTQAPIGPSRIRPQLDSGVDRVLETALNPNPKLRYDSAGAFSLVLGKALRR